MPDLRNLSGREVISIFSGLGFSVISQKGSHVKLRRIADSQKQSLTIPLHREIDKGTLRAIIRQASRYIPMEEVERCFYNIG